MAATNHQRWILALLLPMATACAHVVRPSIAIRYDDLAAMDRRPEVIRLLITDEYQDYVSNDRGHALADPQRYEIGPAVAEITKRYFRASFCEVVVGAAVVPNGHVDYVVTPRVEHFDNSVSLTSLRHRFQIQLAALIEATGSADIRRVTADQATGEYGFADRKNPRTGRGELIPAAVIASEAPGKEHAEKTLGLAIQDAVERLVKQVGSELEDLQPTTAPRSCPRD